MILKVGLLKPNNLKIEFVVDIFTSLVIHPRQKCDRICGGGWFHGLLRFGKSHHLAQTGVYCSKSLFLSSQYPVTFLDNVRYTVELV